MGRKKSDRALLEDATKITFRLTVDEKEEILKYAEDNDLSISQVVRRAIREFLRIAALEDEML